MEPATVNQLRHRVPQTPNRSLFCFIVPYKIFWKLKQKFALGMNWMQENPRLTDSSV